MSPVSVAQDIHRPYCVLERKMSMHRHRPVSREDSYPIKNLQLLVVLQLLFVEADGLVLMAAENTVALHHSISQCI